MLDSCGGVCFINVLNSIFFFNLSGSPNMELVTLESELAKLDNDRKRLQEQISFARHSSQPESSNLIDHDRRQSDPLIRWADSQKPLGDEMLKQRADRVITYLSDPSQGSASTTRDSSPAASLSSMILLGGMPLVDTNVPVVQNLPPPQQEREIESAQNVQFIPTTTSTIPSVPIPSTLLYSRNCMLSKGVQGWGQILFQLTSENLLLCEPDGHVARMTSTANISEGICQVLPGGLIRFLLLVPTEQTDILIEIGEDPNNRLLQVLNASLNQKSGIMIRNTTPNEEVITMARFASPPAVGNISGRKSSISSLPSSVSSVGMVDAISSRAPLSHATIAPHPSSQVVQSLPLTPSAGQQKFRERKLLNQQMLQSQSMHQSGLQPSAACRPSQSSLQHQYQQQQLQAAQQLQTAQQLQGAQQLQTVQQLQGAQQLQTAQQLQGAQQLQTVQQLQGAQQLQTAQQLQGAQQLQTAQQLPPIQSNVLQVAAVTQQQFPPIQSNLQNLPPQQPAPPPTPIHVYQQPESPSKFRPLRQPLQSFQFNSQAYHPLQGVKVTSPPSTGSNYVIKGWPSSP